jgi:ABC-type polysaccharide/polyol phosphate export permease
MMKVKKMSLAKSIAKYDFISQDEGSYLGILWHIIDPLLIFLLIFIIFNNNLGSEIPYYGIYLYIGMIVFKLFQSSTSESSRSLLKNSKIIKSINVPLEIFPLSINLRNLFTHFFEIIILIFLLIYYELNVFLIIFYIPVILLLAIFNYGISLILSGVNVYIPDTNKIWGFFSRGLWFATPIFYKSAETEIIYNFNLINPLYYFIETAREILIKNSLPNTHTIIVIIISPIISISIGSLIFNKLKERIAERV